MLSREEKVCKEAVPPDHRFHSDNQTVKRVNSRQEQQKEFENSKIRKFENEICSSLCFNFQIPALQTSGLHFYRFQIIAYYEFAERLRFNFIYRNARCNLNKMKSAIVNIVKS